MLGGVAFRVGVSWFEADFDFGAVFHGFNAGQLRFKRFCLEIGKMLCQNKFLAAVLNSYLGFIDDFAYLFGLRTCLLQDI